MADWADEVQRAGSIFRLIFHQTLPDVTFKKSRAVSDVTLDQSYTSSGGERMSLEAETSAKVLSLITLGVVRVSCRKPVCTCSELTRGKGYRRSV
ncbi:hypothetical protein E2C01_010935 [Portunus trituberculatus]|uniref:Uncharacterized protein n=1 Tax=Portunus trituberculatus TaxID=210409 RepID=A0A5B7D9X4_PORTR|nr:hypothetical protein [Portunus trituberculatus]